MRPTARDYNTVGRDLQTSRKISRLINNRGPIRICDHRIRSMQGFVVLQHRLPQPMGRPVATSDTSHASGLESTLIETPLPPELSTLPAADRELSVAAPRTALITGAAGLLGREMKARLGETGWRVVAMPRTALDITSEDDVLSAIEAACPDLLINCAATADVDRCEVDADWAYAINERGPAILARACRQFGVEIVHVSTDYVFDGSKEGFYTQEDVPQPLSVYGQSKVAGEVAV